jgi:hypothetical protein
MIAEAHALYLAANTGQQATVTHNFAESVWYRPV